MMETMMDKFFEDFTPEEKQELMVKMMPRMMEGMDMAQMMPMMMSQMMGGMMGGMTGGATGDEDEGDGSPMSRMMDPGSGDEGFNPPDMCRKMVGGMREMVETNKAILEELRKGSA
jgi:hypothetical protein